MQIAMSKAEINKMKEWFEAGADTGYKHGLKNMAGSVIEMIEYAKDEKQFDEQVAEKLKIATRLIEQDYLLTAWKKKGG